MMILNQTVITNNRILREVIDIIVGDVHEDYLVRSIRIEENRV